MSFPVQKCLDRNHFGMTAREKDGSKCCFILGERALVGTGLSGGPSSFQDCCSDELESKNGFAVKPHFLEVAADVEIYRWGIRLV
ncbi:hypothetical protein HYQ44_012008 [Verticillium longisporum]|nr:hypothetical protein HYQ44_012008 [Verticillium longisporum]